MGKLGGETNIPYVIKKGDRYHYKRRWPKDVRSANGLPEYMEKALGTADWRVAHSKAAALNAEFEARCAGLSPKGFETLPQAQQAAFLDAWRARVGFPGAAGGPDAMTAFERTKEEVAYNLRELLSVLAEPPNLEVHWPQFAQRINETLAMLEGVGIDPKQVGIEIPDTASPELRKAAKATEPYTLQRAFDHWKEHKDFGDAYIGQVQYSVKRFMEVNGERQDVREITMTNFWNFLAKIKKMPDSTRARKMSIDAAIAYGEENGLRTLKVVTQAKHLDFVGMVLDSAKSREKLKTNPYDDFPKPKKSKAMRGTDTKPRRDFTPEELESLFAALNKAKTKNSDDWWIPLVGLFTGSRAEEVCDLTMADIVHLHGHPFISINFYGDHKSLKTNAGVRQLPIHPTLLSLGFLDHVASLKAKGEKFLFPSLSSNNNRGLRSDAYLKRFRTVLRSKAAITDEAVTFHSFRHTFKTMQRNASVPIDTQNAMFGHTGGGTNGNYGSAVWAQNLVSEMVKMHPGTDIEALMS